jgi:hypothetical protein
VTRDATKAAWQAPRALNGDDHKRRVPSTVSTSPLEPRTQRQWQRWAFAAVPAVGLIELGAHVVETHSVVPDGDWRAARQYVASQSQPEDLVTFAPGWVDPIGREQFGPEIATIEREARADETRFPRAFEVSIRGAHMASLAAWRRTGEQRFGAVTVTTLENPAPARVLEDLVSLVNPQRLQVSRVEGDKETACSFQHGSPQSGGLGFGPAVPADRFVCPGGAFVGVSVVADLSYVPHRCIYAPSPGGRAFVRLRFGGVHLGRTVHGHHGLYVEAERNQKGAPVTIRFKVGDALIGNVVHRDGDGWKPFEFDTSAMAAATDSDGRADMVVEIEAPNGDRRMYCFEADTR